jgi:hypothetical protein
LNTTFADHDVASFLSLAAAVSVHSSAMATKNVTTDGDDDHQRDIGRLPTEDDVSLAPLARLSSDDEDEDDDVGGATEGDDAWDDFISLVSGLNLNDDDKDEGGIAGSPHCNDLNWCYGVDDLAAQLAASDDADDKDFLDCLDALAQEETEASVGGSTSSNNPSTAVVTLSLLELKEDHLIWLNVVRSVCFACVYC